MNELLNELITEIMSLGEAGKKPAAKKRALKPGESSEHPGYYHRGRGYYSNVSKDGTITHKTDDTGKMVALSPKEKAAKNKDVQQPEQPEKIGSRTTTDIYGLPAGAELKKVSKTTTVYVGDKLVGIIRSKDGNRVYVPTATGKPVLPPESRKGSAGVPSGTTQVDTAKVDTQQTIGDLEARTRISNLSEPKKQVVNGLIDALKPRDGETPEARVERIQKFITDNKILVGSTYRLKAGKIEQFIDEELSLKVFMVLKNIGVTLTHKFDKPVDINALIAYGADKKASGAEGFKPPVVLGDAKDPLDLSVTETGIVVQGERMDTIAPDEENRLVQKRVEAARQSFGEKFTQEWEDNIEEYVRARAREQKRERESEREQERARESKREQERARARESKRQQERA
jgi:hypothetical protein